MKDNKTKKLRLLSYVTFVYMLLALVWWGILLTRKTTASFESKMDHIALKQHHNPSEDFSGEIQVLRRNLTRQHYMIIGEGLVFIIALFIGIWFINRGYATELQNVKHRRNFLLAITHELKSPLASIGLILETIKKRSLETKDKDRLIAHGLKETDRLSLLINNLLLSARLEVDYEPSFTTIDLHSIIENAIENLKNRYPEIKVTTSFETKPLTGSFDYMGMYSAFYNLIENAVKYGSPNAEIRIRTKSKDHEYEVDIADQGQGIEAEEKERIFDQFYRTGQEETRLTQGTGLGLSIVKRMVEIHQGQIEVLDNKPHGSIFRLHLPKSIL